MKHYRAYGLHIASAVELPELAPAPPAPSADLVIERGAPAPVTHEPRDAVRWGVDAGGSGGEALFTWRQVGRFHATAERIRVEPRADVGDDLVAFPLLGPVLATVLHLRGLFVLHASAVAVDGRASVLMGHKGAGKSSTAAAFLAAGHTLVADDIVAIEQTSQGPVLWPGFAQIKLSREALDALSPRGERRAEAHPAIDKVRVRLHEPGTVSHEARAADPLTLERLCILERGGDAEAGFTRRAPAQALEDLLTHSYMARFGPDALAGRTGAGEARLAHLAAAARLASHPGTTLLRVPDGLDHLREAVRGIAHEAVPSPRATQAAGEVAA